MDELIIASKLVRGIVSKLISREVSKKLECKVGIQVNAVYIKIADGQAHAHIDLDGDIGKEEFLKLIRTAGLE